MIGRGASPCGHIDYYRCAPFAHRAPFVFRFFTPNPIPGPYFRSHTFVLRIHTGLRPRRGLNESLGSCSLVWLRVGLGMGLASAMRQRPCGTGSRRLHFTVSAGASPQRGHAAPALGGFTLRYLQGEPEAIMVPLGVAHRGDQRRAGRASGRSGCEGSRYLFPAICRHARGMRPAWDRTLQLTGSWAYVHDHGVFATRLDRNRLVSESV